MMTKSDTTTMCAPSAQHAGQNRSAMHPASPAKGSRPMMTEAFEAEMQRRYTEPLAMTPGLGRALNVGPNRPMKQFKRLLIAIGGMTVLAMGVAMIVLPGPAFIVIPAGLAILAIEFAWARRALRTAQSALPGRLRRSFPPRQMALRFRQYLDVSIRKIQRALWPKRRPA